MSQAVRYRILIIGIDFPIIHTYLRNATQSPSNDILGFVYCGNGDPPVSQIKGTTKTPIKVIPLKKLEEAISINRITKCQFLAQNIPMIQAKSIINRITACNCTLEFLRPKDISVRCHKPVIIISALASSSGKTQVSRHFCFQLANVDFSISVIFPISEIIDEKKGILSESDGLHYEFTDVSEVPSNIFSDDDTWQIKQYLSCRVTRVFATTDVRRAIISAEQLTDIIIVDSRKCEISFIETDHRICTISEDSFNNISKLSLWPGLVNLNMSKIVILVSPENNNFPENTSKFDVMKKILEGKIFFNVKSKYELDGFDGRELLNKPTIVVEHKDNQGKVLRETNSFKPNFVSSKSCQSISLNENEPLIPINSHSVEFNDNNNNNKNYNLNYNSSSSPFLTEGLDDDDDVDDENQKPFIVVDTPRAASPLQEGIIDEINEKMRILTDEINATDAEYVIVSLQHDLEGLQLGKKVIYANPEIVANEELQQWFYEFYEQFLEPPLLKHFEAQVDIIMAMTSASFSELGEPNNESANLESFCRLFLSSHIPPGYKVTTGEIIDSSSNTTGQLDVVVVNDRCPRLTMDATNSIVAPILADNVLCVIEVKKSLTTDQLTKALSQMRPVKALMPTHSTLVQPNGQIIPDPLDGKIITGIFSFFNVENIENKIDEIVEQFPGVVDFIVVPDSFGYFWVETLKVCGLMDKDAKYPPNSYVKKFHKGMGLAFMFGILNSIAAIRRFSGSNLLRYISGCWGAQEEQTAKNVKKFKSYVSTFNKLPISKENKKNIHMGNNNLVNAFEAYYKSYPNRYSDTVKKYDMMKKRQDKR